MLVPYSVIPPTINGGGNYIVRIKQLNETV